MLDFAWRSVRPLLFQLDAERAHELILSLLEHAPGPVLLAAGDRSPAPSLQRSPFGPKLTGPVGLAAGLDKDGRAPTVWSALGFGFAELGTVTALPQQGNPKPRMFRLVNDRAVINRMGFNNHGSEALAARLRVLRERGRWPEAALGANIGKSKLTELEDAPEDYATSTRRLAQLVDYLTVNVSSPNTPGLRSLQARDQLEAVLEAVLEQAGPTPVLVKLAPDLEDEAAAEAVHLARDLGLAGVIATNTTLSREGLTHDPGEAGGLSGAPLWPRARAFIGDVLREAGDLPVVGVGGISTAAEARELLDAGCCAVQLYTSFIFEGPGLPSRLHRELAATEAS